MTFSKSGKYIVPVIFTALLGSQLTFAASHYVSGKISSLLAHATNPAIRISGNITPDDCDGGGYGWLYFAGTVEERNRLYSSALAFSLAGKTVTVYTNNDGQVCKIHNIQVTSGLE
ncbi:hypothetical protein QSV34_07640 [Porticoccus sp. W117]|uniref:hypothetical protein n=1 Tax=Porticoccus sp. W117 TaxID=3054777 RepID=UPI0025941013|nr:hypothetical protein [Porticoccus sp. W117]MDM3871226.1 hypothetical protein [Porticoccus sp. W117]